MATLAGWLVVVGALAAPAPSTEKAFVVPPPISRPTVVAREIAPSLGLRLGPPAGLAVTYGTVTGTEPTDRVTNAFVGFAAGFVGALAIQPHPAAPREPNRLLPTLPPSRASGLTLVLSGTF